MTKLKHRYWTFTLVESRDSCPEVFSAKVNEEIQSLFRQGAKVKLVGQPFQIQPSGFAQAIAFRETTDEEL